MCARQRQREPALHVKCQIGGAPTEHAASPLPVSARCCPARAVVAHVFTAPVCLSYVFFAHQNCRNDACKLSCLPASLPRESISGPAPALGLCFCRLNIANTSCEEKESASLCCFLCHASIGLASSGRVAWKGVEVSKAGIESLAATAEKNNTRTSQSESHRNPGKRRPSSQPFLEVWCRMRTWTWPREREDEAPLASLRP